MSNLSSIVSETFVLGYWFGISFNWLPGLSEKSDRERLKSK